MEIIPKLSVIVPIYNTEKYIEECVNSLISQTYTDIEIILVNDGSTDKSEKKCIELSRNNSKITVQSKDNGGPLSAKKLGLEIASGEYVTFVDADDWIEKNTYEIMMRAMLEYKVDFVASGIIRYYSEKQKKYDYNNIAPGYYYGENYVNEILSHAICDGGFGCIGIDPSMAIKIFRKEAIYSLIKKADAEYGHIYGEDAVVVYPYIMQSTSCVILDKCMYYHRQYENDNSRYISDDNHENELYEMYEYISQFIDKENSRVLMRQLDYYFMFMLHKYNEIRLCNRTGVTRVKDYLFPYNLIKQGSKIVLYGAGSVGKVFWAQLQKTKYCKEVIWVDRHTEINDFVRPIMKYDDVSYYVIAVEKKQLADEITDSLILLGIDREHIIWNDPILKLW